MTIASRCPTSRRPAPRQFSLASCAALLCAAVFSSAVSAAKVEGAGSLQTNVGGLLETYTEFENPNFLKVSDSLQLNQHGIPGSKLLSYAGEAQFGRIGVTSHIGGVAFANPDLSTSVRFGLGFTDLITPMGLNPLTSSYLRLDVGLSGLMTGAGADGAAMGKLTSARFNMIVSDPANPNRFNGVSFIEFAWFGDFFSIKNQSNEGLDVARFIPFAGEEPRFTQILEPGLPQYSFGARGYIDIPLDGSLLVRGDGDEDLLPFGAPFILGVFADAASSCGNEVPACTAITDFGSTALIGNARIVDANGILVAGGFTSESGYDYITPPAPLVPIPEPQNWALLLAGITLLGAWRNRVTRPR